MKNKRNYLVGIIIACFLVNMYLTIAPYDADVSHVTREIKTSRIYQQDEIEQAMNVVCDDFVGSFSGSKLKKLGYDEDNGSISSEKNTIYITSEFTTGFFPATGLNVNSTYTSYKWILKKNAKGIWEVIDVGQGI